MKEKRIYLVATPEIHHAFKVACAVLGVTMKERLMKCVNATIEDAKRKQDGGRNQ